MQAGAFVQPGHWEQVDRCDGKLILTEFQNVNGELLESLVGSSRVRFPYPGELGNLTRSGQDNFQLCTIVQFA